MTQVTAIGVKTENSGDSPKTDTYTSQTQLDTSYSLDANDATCLRSAVCDTNSSSGMGGTTNRKRVFAFQKRWLHSLPIAERTLTEDEYLTHLSHGGSNVPVNAQEMIESRQVVVCMLCDDPTLNQSYLKLWSRSNCRRGRIETHLLSKHPEFMLLLKQKRAAEGELAVQIFLESMREGRCNYRNELSMRLYNHVATPTTLPQAGYTGGYAPDSILLASNCTKDNGTAGYTIPRNVPLSPDTEGTLDEDCDMKRKQARTSLSLQESMRDVSMISDSNSSSQTVVLTEGDQLCMSMIAINLWMLGWNVILTFRNCENLREFQASNQKGPKNLKLKSDCSSQLITILCPFGSMEEVNTWVQDIIQRTLSVNCFIHWNAYDFSSSGPTLFSGNTAIELNLLVYEKLFRGGRGSIIHLIPHPNNLCQRLHRIAVEAITKSLAQEWLHCNVTVNCIALESPDSLATLQINSSAQNTSDQKPRPNLYGSDHFICNAISYILSQSSGIISGSVFRFHGDNWKMALHSDSSGQGRVQKRCCDSI
ncbi:hypothetical protein ABG067_005673 [Albugo candida]